MHHILSLSPPLFFANRDSEPDLEINCTGYVWHNFTALFAVCLPAFAAQCHRDLMGSVSMQRSLQ